MISCCLESLSKEKAWSCCMQVHTNMGAMPNNTQITVYFYPLPKQKTLRFLSFYTSYTHYYVCCVCISKHAKVMHMCNRCKKPILCSGYAPVKSLLFRKKLFSAIHYFVHLNLAISLLLGYLVFVLGNELATTNEVILVP